ncbi:MAG: asparagine synthase (glutamine-hydrolyzing) [Magnetococcales bacterium]|nr:asparagine synthase (glutamine-hydrolyzing) [Magnetococcales bacterium]
MCGIFGCFQPVKGIGHLQDLMTATQALHHRGPDDGTCWYDDPFFFGHRRLAIIDLTSGTQPMATEDGRFVIVFNGEIYNFLELRHTLEQQGVGFATRSDTEAILIGYRHWGLGVLERLQGMFSFAIADRQEQTLLLARDRFGEKPLYYSCHDGGITFSSELSALLTLPSLPKKIADSALAAYMCLNYVPGEQTMIEGVHRLPPASYQLHDRKGGVIRGTYWQPPLGSLPALTKTEAVAELKRRFDQAVALTLRSDVPVSLFLSGGIDSALVAESAVRQGGIKTAYCLDFPRQNFSELSGAQRVAQRLGIELRPISVDETALPDFLAVAAHADDPLGDSSALAVWILAQGVARDYKVVVTGDGGDEMFGGYLTYQATLAFNGLARTTPRFLRTWLADQAARVSPGSGKVTAGYKLKRFLRAMDLSPAEAHFTWNGAWLPQNASRLLASGSQAALLAPEVLATLVAKQGLAHFPTLRQLQEADISNYLPNDILTKVDRMTMAHGLEARAPFLLPDVAEFGLNLPETFKISSGWTSKCLLRSLAGEIYGPAVSQAKKQGFSIPIHPWLRGVLRPILEELLSPASLSECPYLNPVAVLEVKKRHLDGQDQLGFELWGLMILISWFQRLLGSKRFSRAGELRNIQFAANF